MQASYLNVIVKSIPEVRISGLLSNKGEKSINLYFTMVPLRKKN